MCKRCSWPGTDPLYIKYHDEEWGVPLHDENRLFEFLILEGAQAGLSWITILKKREAYRKAYYDFNVKKVARFNIRSVERLLNNPGIVRNRLKIEASITNAQAYLAIQDKYGSFNDFIWNYVDGKAVQNNYKTLKQIPASTPISDKISKDLKKQGFKFVGSTICYAFMQATGMVNDHITGCYRYKEVAKLK
ncbi:MAG: DNA-3-methyladenine glycosylase I [Gammaproteobacteria bacterium]